MEGIPFSTTPTCSGILMSVRSLVVSDADWSRVSSLKEVPSAGPQLKLRSSG